MEVEYWPEGGSITDYTCTMFGTTLGVSVTRAMKYGASNMEIEDAERLLRKKLRGELISQLYTFCLVFSIDFSESLYMFNSYL